MRIEKGSLPRVCRHQRRRPRVFETCSAYIDVQGESRGGGASGSEGHVNEMKTGEMTGRESKVDGHWATTQY